MSTQEAFWIDDEFDRERATDGGPSRYEAHVVQRVDQFADTWGDIAPVQFAATAWRLATTPWLEPGFVRWHRRIIAATCERNAWDGTLTGQVTVVSPWPAALTWSREWWRDRGWRDWPQTFGQYLQPTEHDISRSPHLRALLLIEAPIPLGSLPEAPDGPSPDLAQQARHAVTVLVRELNEIVTPIVRQLEDGVPAQSP